MMPLANAGFYSLTFYLQGDGAAEENPRLLRGRGAVLGRQPTASPSPGLGPACSVHSARGREVSPLCLSRLGKITLLAGEARAEGSCSIELAQSALTHELLRSIENPALS